MKKYFVLLVFILSGFTVIAQTEKEEVEFSEEISKEFSVPAIPALDIISSDPDDISRPSNVKKLAVALYNGIDENGKVKQGIAIEFKLAEYLPIVNISPEEYRNNNFKYLLYNTQVSVGTIATSGDSTSTDLGWGVRLTIFDNSDPMRNRLYREELENILLKCGAPALPTDSIASEEEISKCLKKRKRPVKDSFDKERWNASWMTLAYAGGTRLNGSQISEGKIIGHKVWISTGFPINNWGQHSYLIKWSNEFSEEANGFLNEIEIGSKFLAGGKSYNVFGEVSYNPLLNKDGIDNMIITDKKFSWAVGVEFKISNGVWAVTGIGEEAQRIVGNSGLQLLSGIRMGISDKARLKK